MITVIILVLLTISITLSIHVIQQNKEIDRLTYLGLKYVDRYYDLKNDTRRLIWFIGNQREKVHGCLVRYLQEHYSNNKEDALKIADKIKKNIYGQ